MFGFFGFILIFLLVIVLLVVALVGNLVRAIFGLGRRAPKHFYGNTGSPEPETGYSSTQEPRRSSTFSKKKIFTEDEGEYVEFEEVK